MEHHGIDRYLNHSSKEFCFWEKAEHLFIWEEHLWRAAVNAWDNPHITLQTFLPLPKQLNHAEAAAQEAGKVDKKNYETCHLLQNTEPRSFQTTSMRQLKCL